jgi:hypothetical protein
MSERPKRTGFAAPLALAAGLLVVGFGGGALVWWATRERKPPATEKSAESVPDAEVKRDLAACRRELRARAKARATPPAAAAPAPGEANDAGSERAAKFEVLQKEVNECRVRETLVKSYVCGNIIHHQNLLATLINKSECVDSAGVGKFIVDSFDKCAEFEGFPAHLDEDDLTKVERNAVAASESNLRILTKEKLIDNVKGSHQRCREYLGLPDK